MFISAQADADDEPAALAILNGLKRRHESTGSVPSLIHTVSPMLKRAIIAHPPIVRNRCFTPICISHKSETAPGVLGDDAAGNHPTKTVYSDLDIAHLNTLPQTQPHRAVDLAIVKADKEGKFITSHMTPYSSADSVPGKVTSNLTLSSQALSME